MAVELTIEHIRTSAGARFSTYTSDEDRRVQLIAYYNEVHADTEADQLAEDTDLETVVDAIEEIEDVSTEELWLPNEYRRIDGRERDTILAALRLWQHALDGNVLVTGTDADTIAELQQIAINDDPNQALMSADEIDSLCERLNT